MPLGRQPGAGGDVLEAAVAAVAIQDVLPVVSDEEIEPAVVVVVARADAEAQPVALEPGAAVTSVNVPSRLLR